MSNCLEVDSICSGVGLGARMSRVLASSINHLLARDVARGPGLESVSVRERECLGDSACKSLRR